MTAAGVVAQRSPAPATRDEARARLDAAELVDLAGRALVASSCPTCGQATLGETCPQSLPCPLCEALPGRRCQRASGHIPSHFFAKGWHAARVRAAEARDTARQAADDPTLPAPWPPQNQPARQEMQ